MSAVPQSRIVNVNQRPIRNEGRYILYWMVANRRTQWNFSLDRAVEWASELNKPLVVLEALRTEYPWASARLHQFVLDGMRDNGKRLQDTGVFYYPYVEPSPGEGKGLLEQLASEACVVVTDDFPAFFLPRMIEAAGSKLSVRLEKVDSNGLLPMRVTDRVFTTAFSFRGFLHKNLLQHLDVSPTEDPFRRSTIPSLTSVPVDILERWPPAPVEDDTADILSNLPVDRTITPVAYSGGASTAARVLARFIRKRLASYVDRNDPAIPATSGLSPYLHFGHVGAHQVFDAVAREVGWSPMGVVPEMSGRREGWWGTNEETQAFLDQLVTWRELGFNMCVNHSDHDRYSSLPDWAQQTLAEHAGDPRDYVYDLEQFESASTHDPLWNAAQTQLVEEGRIHNYLRMLWGKKILEWAESPERALEIMLELNNAYALDGRDPNSYSGIFWILGRYDRPWGPERSVFGKVRYMSSENTARKFRVGSYIERYMAPSLSFGAGAVSRAGAGLPE